MECVPSRPSLPRQARQASRAAAFAMSATPWGPVGACWVPKSRRLNRARPVGRRWRPPASRPRTPAPPPRPPGTGLWRLRRRARPQPTMTTSYRTEVLAAKIHQRRRIRRMRCSPRRLVTIRRDQQVRDRPRRVGARRLGRTLRRRSWRRGPRGRGDGCLTLYSREECLCLWPWQGSCKLAGRFLFHHSLILRSVQCCLFRVIRECIREGFLWFSASAKNEDYDLNMTRDALTSIKHLLRFLSLRVKDVPGRGAARELPGAGAGTV